ncbi:MAG: GDP-L-fucose synthase [Burkholderiales bacterium]|nr:GDP-L-fucose synthase [Burkholderiales bacterium]
MNTTSKIYVAGHSGLVGSAIVKQLQALGYANLILQTHKELDLINQKQVNDFFSSEKPEYVFLAAAKVGGILANNTYRADFIYQNLQIQNNVIHASHINQVKKLLFLGSSCIYPKYATQPIKEDYLLSSELEYTNEPYAIAKIAGIKMCESYNIQYGTNFIAAMPTNLYGHNDNFDLENSHVIPAMIRKIYLAKLLSDNDMENIRNNLNLDSEINIMRKLNDIGVSKISNNVVLKLWGTGTPKREFLHSSDMADACVYIMNNINFESLVPDMGEIRNTHINIGTGEDISIRDLALLIAELIGYKDTIEFDPSKPDGIMRKLSDVSKLQNLGWKYKLKLREGLARVVNEYII